MALEEKRTDLIKTQTGLQEMEDKYYSSTASVQDAAVADLRVCKMVTQFFVFSSEEEGNVGTGSQSMDKHP